MSATGREGQIEREKGGGTAACRDVEQGGGDVGEWRSREEIEAAGGCFVSVDSLFCKERDC